MWVSPPGRALSHRISCRRAAQVEALEEMLEERADHAPARLSAALAARDGALAEVERQRAAAAAARAAATKVLEGVLVEFATGEAEMRLHVEGAVQAKHDLMAVVSELQVIPLYP